jgi:hypothetical protein
VVVLREVGLGTGVVGRGVGALVWFPVGGKARWSKEERNELSTLQCR